MPLDRAISPLSFTPRTLVLLALLFAPGSGLQAGHDPETPTELLLDLEDQNGRRFDTRQGDRLVFVIGGKDVPRETERWADELEAVLPDACRVIRLLDLQDVPRAGGPLVRRKIRKQIGSAPKRIFLDWDGAIARKFGVRIDVPVMVCLDEDESVVRVVEGDYSPRKRSEIEGLYPPATTQPRREIP